MAPARRFLDGTQPEPGSAAVQPGRRDRLQRPRHRRRRALRADHARAARRGGRCSRASAPTTLAEHPALAGQAAAGCCSRPSAGMLSAQVYDVIDAHATGARTHAPARRRTTSRGLPRWCASARRCASASRELKRFLFGRCTAIRRSRNRPSVAQHVVRSCSPPTSTQPSRDAGRLRRRRRPAARGGRLHRRHDRPLRACASSRA